MLKAENIKIMSQSMNAEEALRAIGEVLLNSGSVTEQYIANMIASYHTMGPYFVIAPGIALAHAKPDDSVKSNDIALIVCKEPVVFESHNDPVYLLFGLCATSSHSHMEVLVDMANLLSDESKVNQIKEAASKENVLEIITQG